MTKYWQRGWVSKREMEFFGEPVGMPDRGTAYGEKLDPLSIIGPVVGGLMGSDASSNAANAQERAARDATQLQRDMFERQIQLNAPFRDAGITAQNRLMHLLGLKVPASSTVGGSGDYNAIRAQLLPQYTRAAGPGEGDTYNMFGALTGGPIYDGENTIIGWKPPKGSQGGTIDEAGLELAIKRQMETAAANQEPYGTDAEFGSLMRDFGMADFEKDPGYAFRLAEGNKALERSAAARGGLLSGAAVKDALRYNQDAASQEYGNAFNRFQVNRSNKLNPLQALMGSAQTATGQMGNAAQNFGTQAGNNMVQAGNAQASGYMGSANAMAQGIGGAYNNYQNNNLMSRLFGGGSSFGGSFDPYTSAMNGGFIPQGL